MPEYLIHLIPLFLIGVCFYFFCRKHLEKYIKSTLKLTVATLVTTTMLAALVYFGLLTLLIFYVHNTSDF